MDGRDADGPAGSRRGVAFVALPSNAVGQPVDPTEWNRNDGFSPGSPVLTFVPELDLHVTWGSQDEPTSLPDIAPNEPGYFDYRDHIAAPGRYLRPDAPIVILDAGTRHTGRGAAADPAPRRELRGGAPLHRGAAESEARGRQRDRAERELPRLSERRRRRRALRPHGVALRDARGGGHRSRRTLSGLGLHGGERAQPERAVAPHSRRRLRDPGRHRSGRPARAGRGAQLRGHVRGGLPEGRLRGAGLRRGYAAARARPRAGAQLSRRQPRRRAGRARLALLRRRRRRCTGTACSATRTR
jgi:hypothetical protein